MARVLLLLPAAGYRNEDFLSAAQKLNVEVIAAADYCWRLAPLMGMSPILSLPFDRPAIALEQALDSLGRRVDAVLAVDDHGLELAALLREKLGLPGNSPQAVRSTRDKLAFRQLLESNGFNCPQFQVAASDTDVRALASSLQYPVVVKARRLSASRGVVRADDAASFVRAVAQVRRIQALADRDAAQLGLILEDFIPGAEYALEGLQEDGGLRVLALFDKPDPLDGPYFEETLYVTPSRLPVQIQKAIAGEVGRACALAGLASGPVHAEVRVNDQGIWLLEVAARSIGGLCGRVLNHRLGMPLEELVLRDALGMPIPPPANDDAAGVMMIPVPGRGIFRGARGLEAARAIPGVDDIRITAQTGQLVAPPPEGSGYLGFIFSRAGASQSAEAALRAAHAALEFEIQADRPLARVCAQGRV
ncbi:MAG: ATP-grasp domain-containing protein [Betaproteobacteria bacterium]|nr:ATP-grasp domain-containing protein [Betaproteobacteria bacterium]